MDDNFTFWYPTIMEIQIGLDGQEFHKEVLLEGHIIHSGRLMCRESKEIIKNRIKVKTGAKEVNEKTSKLRVERKKLCEECLRLYKKNNDSAWTAWIEGKAKTPAAKLSPLAKL